MIEKLVDQNGTELFPPFTYLYNKDLDLSKLEIETRDSAIMQGVFTVHYKAAYYDSIVLDDATYANTFQLHIAPQSTCDPNSFTVPTPLTFKYGMNPNLSMPTDFNFDLPYGNGNWHFFLENQVTDPLAWLALNDQVLT